MKQNKKCRKEKRMRKTKRILALILALILSVTVLSEGQPVYAAEPQEEGIDEAGKDAKNPDNFAAKIVKIKIDKPVTDSSGRKCLPVEVQISSKEDLSNSELVEFLEGCVRAVLADGRKAEGVAGNGMTLMGPVKPDVPLDRNMWSWKWKSGSGEGVIKYMLPLLNEGEKQTVEKSAATGQNEVNALKVGDKVILQNETWLKGGETVVRSNEAAFTIENESAYPKTITPGSAPDPEPVYPITGTGEATDPQPVLSEDKAQSLTLIKGQKFLLAEKDWTADKESKKIVSVSKGNVKAKKAGKADLTRGSGEDQQIISAVVLDPKLTKEEKTLKVEAGEDGQLSLGGCKAADGMILLPGAPEELPIAFFSDSVDVATVDDSGNVHGVASGNTTVRAWVNGVSFKFKVKVSETKGPALERTLHVNVGKSKSVKIKTPKGMTKIKTKWKVAEGEEEGIVDIKNGTKIKGLKPGEVTLECEGLRMKVTVEDPSIVGSAKPYSATKELNIQETDSVSLTDVKQPYHFSSNKPSVAYMDKNGMVHARSKGNAKIGVRINGQTVAYKIKVNVNK